MGTSEKPEELRQAAAVALAPRSGRGRRRHDDNVDGEAISAATRADILKAAEEEFAAHGYDRANIVEIARRTRTSKRMIYYYFESKHGLYKAVLKGAYASLRQEGAFENKAKLPPVEALRRYAEAIFDSHLRHPRLVRLSLYENIGRAETLNELRDAIGDYPSNLEPLEDILAAGEADGSIRPGLRQMDLYLMATGLSFHTISNAHSIKSIFDHDMLAEAETRARRQMIGDMICRYAATPKWLAAHEGGGRGPGS